jgi:hypothetical protein
VPQIQIVSNLFALLSNDLCWLFYVAAVVSKIRSRQAAKSKYLFYTRKKPTFKTDSIYEQVVEHNIWTEEGQNDRRTEKTAK